MSNQMEANVKKLLHAIAHSLGWAGGQSYTFASVSGLYTGLRCRQCGRIMRIHRVPESLTEDLE
jgi:hypothetical protein